jgi:hypothetical protein
VKEFVDIPLRPRQGQAISAATAVPSPIPIDALLQPRFHTASNARIAQFWR